VLKKQTQNMPEYVAIGYIQRAHGVHGYLKVQSLTDHPERFRLLEKAYLSHENGARQCHSLQDVKLANGYILLKLADISTREQAEKLRGYVIEVPGTDVLPLPEGHHYYFEYFGLQVKTEDGTFVGTVQDIDHYPSGDMLIVKNGDKEYLLPDVADIVIEKNIAAGVITVRPVEGLLEL
jgi:16S rRNA processing protein RimM